MPHIPATPPRVRIAPSPTGTPHVGTAYIALFNRSFAQRFGGKFILRIEDTDRDRSRREYEDAIMQALRWLGLSWDEGPDVGGPYGPYRQSERGPHYVEHANLLIKRGAAYKCWCTRDRLDMLDKRQTAEKLKRGYDKHCLLLSDADKRAKEASGEPFVVRIDIPQEGETRYTDLLRGEMVWRNAELTDYVLLKSDGMPTYHLANVVDDHLMKITHVIRAEEWISSLPLHYRLYDAFGWSDTRPTFCHMPLLRNADHSKISKRKNPVSIDFYRSIGIIPTALLNFLGLQGYSMPGKDAAPPAAGAPAPKLNDKERAAKEYFPIEEFVANFDLTRVNTSGPVFDLQKLRDLNAEHLRRLSHEQRKALILDHVGGWVDRLAGLATDRMAFLSDYAQMNAFYSAWEIEISKDSFAPAVKAGMPIESVIVGLTALLDSIADLQPHMWTDHGLEAVLDGVLKANNWTEKKPKTAFMQAVRIAVSGRTFTPPLHNTLSVMERYTVVSRLTKALDALNKK